MAWIRIEVYKTTVDDRSIAKKILEFLHEILPNCKASFDLDDVGNVLRIESTTDRFSEAKIRDLLHRYDHQIEKLA